MTALIISYNDDIDPDIVAGVATVGSIKNATIQGGRVIL